MRSIFLITALFFTALIYAQNPMKGSIAGKLLDKEMNGDPLPFANIIIKGTSTGTMSDVDGLFVIDNIDPGTYTISFSFVGYETLEVPNIAVVAGKVTEINTALGASAAALDEVLISTVSRRDSEVALLLEQKKAVSIMQSIGTEELTRKAVSTVEQGLSKVSGITTVQDRGVFVRGLDDRYNYLMVNGLPVASSDPDFKIIPLNYISTNIISSVDVFKTFNPTLYQDFAGASFALNTKTAPATSVTTVNIGVNYNTNSTFKDFKTDDAGDLEYLGYTGEERKFPASIELGQTGFAATPQESAGLFNTSWTPTTKTAPLDTQFGFSHGQRIYSNERENMGYVFGLNFRNSHQNRTGVERTLNSEGTAGQDFRTQTFDYSTQKSALFSLNYNKFNRLALTFNTIYLQNTSNFIREAAGTNDGFTQLNNRDFFIRDSKYTENNLITLQLLGNYEWANKKHQINFATSGSKGKNNVPDRRVLRAAGQGEDAEYITTNGINPFKFYQTLDNFNVNGRVEYTLGLQPVEDVFKTNIKLGYNFDVIEYDFVTRFITAQVNTSNLPNLNTNDPERFFRQGFAEGFLRYTGTFDPTATSKIDQYINAGYLNISREWEKLLLEIGVRAEYAPRQITYRRPLDRPDTPYKVIKYDPMDLSPSFNVKYLVNEVANLRFAGSVTTTRPRLREILPTVYQGGDGNQVIGNPELLNSRNYNLDLKYEVFPTNSQILAVTLFGKYLENPIERLARSTSVGYRTFFDNFDRAYLYGIELEAKLNAGDIFKNEDLEKFTMGFNGILMSSNASAPEDNPNFAAVTNKNRQLQGASNWGINADLGYRIYKNNTRESSLNLIFNTFGERIYAVGVEGADEIYEKPMNLLDLTWNTQLNDHWGIRLTARNILDEETLFKQDPTREIRFPATFSNVIESFNVGTTFGANITYKF
ncbi:TonB-dependent receptor [soil metagenome]